MKILILGGTRFVGRHLATEALLRGHELTLFNRGRSGPGLFPNAEHRRGDRDGGLDALAEGEWDACFDTSGQTPRQVEASTDLLAERVGHYGFISSASAYADRDRAPLSEDAPLASADSPDDLDRRVATTYGARKAACEEVVRKRFGARASILRPSLVAGPYDDSGRFDYWLRRALSGGELLAPGPAHDPVQLLDARDLATFALDLAEREIGGTYNVAGPADDVTFMGLVRGAVNAAGSAARVTWVDPGFLLERGAEPWTEIPLWIPEDGPRGLHGLDVSAARARGFAPRQVGETLRDTLVWIENSATEPVAGIGLDPQRERELLREWHRSQAMSRTLLAAGHEI
ncbi:NAD-dependent epimerase/dehydratase family protein [Engelhardtia mirabilis]|uniref:NAD dependent epimerase/dehydratase family protein n=1 Tax=Engelhardtia mirabilis TaxID=2528011 RepID=A0A518BSJ4_9BACT|nr:NAD dependent epimerase/dehydratase family protein [Planctomycetes bacterium Pla133]QDV04266.1 NAD dependent epimerase/dehydratase family protein [Planctomycetes bacterium Pla86]